MIYPLSVNHLFHASIRNEALHLDFRTLDLKKLYTTGKVRGTCPKSVIDRFFTVMTCFRSISEDNYENCLNSLTMLNHEFVSAPNNHKVCLTNHWHLAFSVQKDDQGLFFCIEKLMPPA